MDTNSNNQNDNHKIISEKKDGKNFFTTSLATVLMIFIFAVISVVSYIPIRDIYFPVEDNVKNYIENNGSNGMAYNIARLTRELQHSVNRTDDWVDNRYTDIKSVKYKIYPLNEHKDTDQILENGMDDEGAETGKDTKIQRRSITNMPHISDSELQAEIDDSLLYIKITFDEGGHPVIKSVAGNKFKDEGVRFNNDLIAGYLRRQQGEEAEQYANLEAIYIIPQDFESHDDMLTLDMKEHHVFSSYLFLILTIGAISIFILIMAAFAIPYSLQNRVAVCRGFNKMPLELKLVVWALLMALCGINIAAVESLTGYSYNYTNPLIKMVYDADPYFYIIGIPITFILYLLIYLGMVYIKHIYYTGFKKGFIENSIFGKTALNLTGNTKRILKKAAAIDLREDNQRRLIGIAVMNFFVIIILGSGGFWGFVLAAIYSIIVLRHILKLVEDASKLNLASEQVSAGNFDIKVSDDMGILTPMAKNLNNIKQGFSLAVDKEIKSERMKTELISNVSHDLKTPLTSIITYVDLLKNEDADLETRMKYIDIIDRKSKRLKILIEDLFEASKATSGNIDLNLENIDAVALLRQTLGELEEKIDESSLQFRISTPGDKITCNLDGKRTYRVFENIISNILKYSMENSRVYIDVTESEQEVSFTFKNISAYEMNFDPSHITERFIRGDESRSTDGAGLGLSIAGSLVELQGGSLDIIIDGDLFKLIVIFPVVHVND